MPFHPSPIPPLYPSLNPSIPSPPPSLSCRINLFLLKLQLIALFCDETNLLLTHFFLQCVDSVCKTNIKKKQGQQALQMRPKVGGVTNLESVGTMVNREAAQLEIENKILEIDIGR